jgi:hypothetical protein
LLLRDGVNLLLLLERRRTFQRRHVPVRKERLCTPHGSLVE